VAAFVAACLANVGQSWACGATQCSHVAGHHVKMESRVGREQRARRPMKYLIVIERTGTGFSAYSPDLPGCIATGKTRDEVEREMKGAIALHLDGLKAEGIAIPQPSSSSSYVEIPA
jgi:predicted RNase H-like HicB family nuclease